MEISREVKQMIALEASRDCNELQMRMQKYASMQLSEQDQYNLSQEMLYISRKVVFECKLLNGHTPEY